MSGSNQKRRPGEDLLGKIISIIPGYGGYKKKEWRRESDSLIRNKAVSLLKEAELMLEDLLSEAVMRRRSEEKIDIQRVIWKVHHLREDVRSAEAGYAPFFDVKKVKEDELDSLINFDSTILSECDEIGRLARNLEVRDDNSWEDVKRNLSKIGALAKRVNSEFRSREDIISRVGEVA